MAKGRLLIAEDEEGLRWVLEKGFRQARFAVTSAYQSACAVTMEHSLPVLDAAHIRPYSDGGEHEVSNGLLLRSDIHRLFDKVPNLIDQLARLVFGLRPALVLAQNLVALVHDQGTHARTTQVHAYNQFFWFRHCVSFRRPIAVRGDSLPQE